MAEKTGTTNLEAPEKSSNTFKDIKKVGQTIIKPVKGRSIPKPVNPGVVLSKTQMAINELFNGERTFGTGQNLPKINGALTSGGGLIKHSDRIERRTAGLFGLR